MNRGVVPAASLAAAILGLATASLVLRLPGSVILMGVASVTALLITGLSRPRSDTWPLWLFLGSAILSSSLSIAIAPAGIVPVNFTTLAIIFTVFAIAVLCGHSGRTISRAVARALYYTFGFALAVGWLEVATGIRLRADNANPPPSGPFLTSAWFVNYNDLAVVITMFAIMVLLRFLLDARGPLVQLGRATAYLAAAALIVLAGSRGALVGLLAGSMLVFLQAIRVRHPKLVGGLAAVSVAAVSVVASTLVLSSAWFQDNSTQARGTILTRTLDITLDDQFHFWLGWGDLESFIEASSRSFPGELMDPHNLLLEVLIWYGATTLVAFVVLWFVILRRGLWRMEAPTDWTSVGLIILFTLAPVLGTVPSSSLRYYYVFLIAPCAMAILTSGGQRNHRTAARDLPRSLPPRPLVNEGVSIPPGENA